MMKFLTKWVDPRGKVEEGTGSGVYRDIYSTFWREVSDAYLIGEQERVPFIRHDLFSPEWEAMGLIILKGYRDTGYFPTILCKAFLHFCLFGDVADDVLLSSFFKYLSQDESSVVSKALNGNDDNIIETEEFSDLLEQFKCRTLVNETNVKTVIIELARQELIQKTHLMSSSWKNPLAELKKEIQFSSPENISEFYDKLEPSTKKVVSLLKASPLSNGETESFNFFKRYIRGLDMILLKRLMKFLTGSELLVVDSIDVAFIKPETNFARRPIAHTCSPCLELPSNYNSYGELREEFSHILQLCDWEMNIV